MDRQQKKESVEQYNSTFTDSQSVIVTHYKGLTVAQMSDLRVKLLEAGAGFKVAKNRLAKIALKGTSYENLDDLFSGPTGIAYSSDSVSAAKVVYEFAKDNDKLVIVGGGLGENRLDVAGVEALAKLPSLDELRGKLVGMIQTPASRMASITQAPAGQLARVFGAYGSQG